MKIPGQSETSIKAVSSLKDSAADNAYVIAVPAPVYRLSDSSFAIEDAFSHHLRELKSRLGEHAGKVIVVAPELSRSDFDNNPSLGIITADEGIEAVPTYPASASTKEFWFRHVPKLWRVLDRTIRRAVVVHTGPAHDTWRPMLLLVNFIAWRYGRRALFVVDIDFRRNTERLRQLGMWSRKTYLINRLLHDPLRWAQVWLAVRLSKLVLLKGPKLVRDFGKGRASVKNVLDTAHSLEQVLSDEELNQRLSWIDDETRPLNLVYFGRLVQYKGMDRAIEAIRLARSRGNDIRLTIIGSGPEAQSLHRQTEEAGLSQAVTFLPAVKYGEPLFRLLFNFHASIACPLLEDTPRSAFDSMARGLPIVAFNLDYFNDLAEMSGAVKTTAWPSAENLAEAFVALDENRSDLKRQVRQAVDFARANTQQIWMERRQAWLMEYVLDVPARSANHDEDETPKGNRLYAFSQ